MTITQTDIATAHASKYLQQLCKHWAHKLPVEFTPEAGRVSFADTVCDMRADETALHVQVQSADAANAERIAGIVFAHLKRFAFREELAEPVWRAA